MNKLVLYLLCLLLVGCTKKKSVVPFDVISINVDSCKELDLKLGKIIPLETSDSSLLYDIVSVDPIKNKYFIRSRSKVLAFGEDGKFLYNISGKGQGNKEYVSMTSFFIDNNELCIYDNTTYRILRFDPSGAYIKTERVMIDNNQECIPYLIFPLGNKKYLAKNQFNGTPEAATPLLSLLDNNYNVVHKVDGRLCQTGFSLFDFISYDYKKNAATYWEPLNDTIYTVVDNKISPKYVVDFGENAIPIAERLNKDIYDLIDFANKPENIKYATFVRYAYEEEKYVYFVFGYKKEIMLAKYNKQNQKSTLYALSPDKYGQRYRFASFFKINKEEIIMVLEDCQNIENNQSLFIIDKNTLNES